MISLLRQFFITDMKISTRPTACENLFGPVNFRNFCNLYLHPLFSLSLCYYLMFCTCTVKQLANDDKTLWPWYNTLVNEEHHLRDCDTPLYGSVLILWHHFTDLSWSYDTTLSICLEWHHFIDLSWSCVTTFSLSIMCTILFFWSEIYRNYFYNFEKVIIFEQFLVEF